MQQAGQAQIIQGDALDVLRTLPAKSVQCVVTSPPYFGLRDYGTAEWDGGAEDCEHLEPDSGPTQNKGNNGKNGHPFRDACRNCGATRIDRQIGLESTPAEYVAKMVAVFREVRRVLRKDGVCWLNIGDSYAAGKTGGIHGNLETSTLHGGRGVFAHEKSAEMGTAVIHRKPAEGLKPKDLMGMPWRLAFALQADGWYLRQDIIWAKPNPMPESVTDRCTKAHEYVFLLSKSERYFYNAGAISEPCDRGDAGSLFDAGKTAEHQLGRASTLLRVHRKPAGWATHAGAHGSFHEDGRAQQVEYTEAVSERRNKRSVWTITTEPYPEAHFATFPTELPRICILAGSKLGDVILDPFAGSGTTLQVALELGRAGIGIELNADYVALANRRLNSTTLGLPLEIAA